VQRHGSKRREQCSGLGPTSVPTVSIVIIRKATAEDWTGIYPFFSAIVLPDRLPQYRRFQARDPWPQRDLALAGLLAGTAARAGEVCALTVGDLVLGGEEPYVRVIGKGSVTWDCPLSPELVGVLQSYLASHQARTGTPARTKDPVFLNTRLAPLSTAALDHSVRRWFARADVPLPPGAAAHAFRHTVAMQLIGLGESATVVQDLLGHASLSSTQVYTKAVGRHVRAANALPLRQLVRDLPEPSPVTD